jgi:hypothetical protein
MQNWQDLIDYINDELLSTESTLVEQPRPSNNYWLRLANEAFKHLGVLDRINFTPTGGTGVSEITKPISCDKVYEVIYKNKSLLKADASEFRSAHGLVYVLTPNKVVFNQEIDFVTGEIILKGSGSLPAMVKDPSALSTPFSILNERFHEAIGYYMLWRFWTGQPTREAQQMAINYKTAFDLDRQRYIFSLRKAKSGFPKLSVFEDMKPRIVSKTEYHYNYINNIDAYTKAEIDAIIQNALQTAETTATGLANTAQTNAQGYTNTMVGEINTVLDDINGEDA